MLATEHILASGVDPSNLHLVGDSAGANLLTGLLSHILHPLDTVRPIIAPKGSIKSVYLMSPVDLSGLLLAVHGQRGV